MLLDFLTLVVRLVLAGIIMSIVSSLMVLMYFWWSDYLHERKLRNLERETIDVIE